MANRYGCGVRIRKRAATPAFRRREASNHPLDEHLRRRRLRRHSGACSSPPVPGWIRATNLVREAVPCARSIRVRSDPDTGLSGIPGLAPGGWSVENLTILRLAVNCEGLRGAHRPYTVLYQQHNLVVSGATNAFVVASRATRDYSLIIELCVVRTPSAVLLVVSRATHDSRESCDSRLALVVSR